jgi:putative oxidoreductase
MKIKVPTIARLLLGLIYFVFGLNGFFNFLKMSPPPMGEKATAFFTGIAGSGYFLPVLSGTEALGGFLLLIGFGAPLGLILLAPLTIHILLFHYFLTPGLSNLGLPIAMVVCHLIAAAAYWKVYRPLFSKGI